MASSAAALFSDARLGAHAVTALPSLAGEAEGYAVQELLVSDGRFGALVGYKVGATNDGAKAALGLSSPFSGPLFASARCAPGAAVSLASLGPSFKAAEAEFAFTLCAPLPPRPQAYSADEVWASVGSVCPAIELAVSRLVLPAGTAPTLPAILADSAWNGCFVLGEGVAAAELGKGEALVAARATLLCDDRVLGAETGANVLGSPLASLVWLVNSLSARGLTLEAGHVVISGAAVAAKGPFTGGEVLTARFEGLGAPLEVSLRLLA